ncbi:MAG: hypothetical protein KGY45_00010 [Hadesarchaea archaeon]|nr:hypothetical protein [Hadesarchaea archaeon]
MSDEENSSKESGEPEEFLPSEVIGFPQILCPDDHVPLELADIEKKEVEERKFIFKTETEEHLHIRYECPECDGYFLHDIERKREGCFIATAAYGTPMVEEINILRKFRDTYLMHRDWGEKLVETYYYLSPPIANLIEKSENLKKIVRTCLKPIIKILKNR